VLGDSHQQHVEEEPLILGGLAPTEQQVEVLGEAEPAHQITGEIAPAHLDPVRIGLADMAHGPPAHAGTVSSAARFSSGRTTLESLLRHRAIRDRRH
jgi:hypothetical protein